MTKLETNMKLMVDCIHEYYANLKRYKTLDIEFNETELKAPLLIPINKVFRVDKYPEVVINANMSAIYLYHGCHECYLEDGFCDSGDCKAHSHVVIPTKDLLDTFFVLIANMVATISEREKDIDSLL